MWSFLIKSKLALGLIAELIFHPFRVPDDFHDVFNDEEEL